MTGASGRRALPSGPTRRGLPDHDSTARDAAIDAWAQRSSGPVNWRTLPPQQARMVWQELRAWVDWFRIEFSYDHRVVPPCWHQHRALTDLLSALHDHWRSAYDPMSAAASASEWHRALIPLEARLREWAARTGCSPKEHRPDLIA